jgi:TrmH family RNA methyltransferase
MPACVLLEGIQDPGNVGSILRTAAAAGVRHVLLSESSVHAWSPRVLRAGMGAHFMLEIHEQADLIAVATAFRGRVVAASRGAPRFLYECDLTGKVALLFGNEGGGLSRSLRAVAHDEVSIPMPGGSESLNVAAAVAVVLFERVRQLTAMQSATR